MAVGEAQLATVRAAFAEFDVAHDGDLPAYYRRFFTQDAVVEPVDGFPVVGRYVGLDGYLRWFEEGYGPYTDVRRRFDGLEVIGEFVVVLLTLSGRSPGDDLELQVQTSTVYSFERDRISHLRIFTGHERGLAFARGTLT